MATSGSTNWSINRDALITSALRKLMVLPSGGTASAAQLSDGATALNALVKAFHADGMPLWAIASYSFDTVTDTATYTIGPSKTLNTVAWPQKIIQAHRTTAGENKIPLRVENRYDFKDLPVAGSGLPIILYYQPYSLYGEITLWPAPEDATHEIIIQYQRPFEDMDASTDDFDFPSYWMQALIYNLAWTLAPEYGIPPTDRGLLQKEAMFWKGEALSYGTEEGSMYMSPNTRGR
jgi:hypothetical protein